ncbi:MAG TPA: hypothetical protein VIS72_04155, partial [Anaerolineales bacterium]
TGKRGPPSPRRPSCRRSLIGFGKADPFIFMPGDNKLLVVVDGLAMEPERIRKKYPDINLF